MSYADPLSVESWRHRISVCKRERRTLVDAWEENVEYRRGKPFSVETDDDRVNVNADWALVKSKHAQLWSQTPSVVLTAKRDELKPLAPAFSRELNETLTGANVGAAMDECVLDCINASGIGAMIVRYESRTEQVDVPAVDPVAAAALQQGGRAVPTVKATRVTSKRFVAERFSPSDLLWPIEFDRSDWDQAPWLGRSGRMSWAEAKHAFALKDTDREKVCGGAERRQTLRDDEATGADIAADVEYDEIFYWQHRFDPAAKYFTAIQRLVFVHGIDKPVVDEPWNGQAFDPGTGQYFGARRLPIRVLTLAYISDDAIPPSDSAIGRPQVNELIRTRTQMLLNRERSIPIRWHDVNRLDPLVAANLMRGTWQGSIPVQGNGTAAIGEVARAAYPRDDYQLDTIAKHDLQEQWSLGSSQMGVFASGERSATEANQIGAANAARIGYERSRVAAFFVGAAEVLAGLLALYGDLEGVPEGIDRRSLAQAFTFTIRPDSAVLRDANARLQQLSQFLNLTAKSGFVNVGPVIEEMCQLSDLDPALIIKQPEGRPPDPVNISVRNAEDLMNPLFLALLAKTGQAPSPEELQAAQQMIAVAFGRAPLPVVPPSPPPQGDPDFGPMERITKRVEEIGG